MKNWKAAMVMALATVGGFSAPAWAKDRAVKKSDIPPAVLKTVSIRYPNVKPSHFSTDTEHGKTVYEVKLDVEGRATELSLAADGTVLSEEQRIEAGELPAPVKSAFDASSHAKAKIVRAEKEQKGGVTNYELLVEQDGERAELVFDAGGKLVTPDDRSDEGKGGKGEHEPDGEEKD